MRQFIIVGSICEQIILQIEDVTPKVFIVIILLRFLLGSLGLGSRTTIKEPPKKLNIYYLQFNLMSS